MSGRRIYALIAGVALVIAGLAFLTPSGAEPDTGTSVPTLAEHNDLEARVTDLEARVDALEADPDPDPTPEPTPDPTPDPTDPPGDITHGSQLTHADVGPTGPLTASGSITTTTDGEVIEDVEVTGRILVEHENVIIRNVKVNVTGRYGVEIPIALHDGGASYTMTDSEVAGVSGERSACVVHYGTWTIERSYIHGCSDGVKMLSNQTLQESIVEGPYYDGPEGDAHNDAVQTVGGSNSKLIRNKLHGPFQAQTSAFILQTNNGPIDGWLIESNELSGGGFTAYIRDKGNGHGVPTNMAVTDNVWVKDSWSFGPTSLHPHTSWTWEDNRMDDGTPVTCGGC